MGEEEIPSKEECQKLTEPNLYELVEKLLIEKQQQREMINTLQIAIKEMGKMKMCFDNLLSVLVDKKILTAEEVEKRVYGGC